MKPVKWALAFLLFAVVPAAPAQQTSDPKQNVLQSRRIETKSAGDDIDVFVAQHHGRTGATVVPACKDLDSLAEEMEEHFKAENPQNNLDPILAAIQGRDTAKQWTDIPSDAPDRTWETLVDCAEQTKSQSQRAEALRVLAIWEKIRSDNFRKRYLAAQPIQAPSCTDLDKLDAQTKAIMPTKETFENGTYRRPDTFGDILGPLVGCSDESKKLNAGRPVPEYVQADKDLAMLSHADHVSNENRLLAEANDAVADYNRAVDQLNKLRNPARWTAEHARETIADSAFPVRTDEPSAEELAQAANRCDQIITIAGLTPGGLALYVPPEGQRFMAKNAKNYPRMCLVENTNATTFAPNVPHYLLVWAYSDAAFAGFQPVQQIATAPVSGSGTLTNLYGERWNFTFNGTLTEIDTVEAPYVLQSRTLYLWAYDEKGNVVSRHSITTSSQAGGDATYAAGYNAGALISLLWNNPAHLIKSVLKDVQKASGH